MPKASPKPQAPKPQRREYVVLAPVLDYLPSGHAERGDIVDDLPAESISSLLKLGDIAIADDLDLDDLPAPPAPAVTVTQTRVVVEGELADDIVKDIFGDDYEESN